MIWWSGSLRPRKDRFQAQSDGRRVQGVDGIGQLQPQLTSSMYSVDRLELILPLGLRRINTPVAPIELASASVERRTGWRNPM